MSTHQLEQNVSEEAKSMIALVTKMAEENIMKAIKSGALDLSKSPTELTAGKIIAKAALESAVDQYLQLGKFEKEVKNLRHFV